MKIVCVSGYFDPFHIGHLEYLEKSKKLGDYLFVIVNNDFQAQLKKKKSFMNEYERLNIIRSLKCVDSAILSIDKDRTVIETLKIIKPDIFTNGGDQNNSTIPEIKICNELGIELVDGLGDKIQSSSWLIKASKN
uniref:Cytidyltransferase-like domain-containing protein n=1 Tax=viral metagenome TaxID=1070528 RepID=A0A6C0J145_9ZZZZ